jgi:hypothetical protein
MEDRETMKSELVKAGWVTSPNNIFGLPGVMMYPGARGMKRPAGCLTDVQVLADSIRVLKPVLSSDLETRSLRFETGELATLAVFDDCAAFLAWVELTGVVPEDGPNVWD